MRKLFLVLVGLSPAFAASMALAASDYTQTVESYNPIAYYQFSSSSGGQSNSSVNGFTGTLENGATVGGTGPAIADDPGNSALVLNNPASGGTSQYLNTNVPINTHASEISNAGTILAWINLASLPSTAGRIYYIAGESTNGDDFDLQIETDNKLKFYTDGGSATVDPTALTTLNQWIFVAATFTAGTDRSIYVNGVNVAASTPGGHNPGSDPFSIGASDVFGNRYLDGSIDEVAFYNSDLSATDIADIYASAKIPASSVPTPASLWGGASLLGILAAGMTRKRVAVPVK